MKLSVIIPSYKDPLLFKTIQSLLDTSELPKDQLEIIAVWDGYYPDSSLIIEDPRVRYVHLGKNRGMRGAINAGVEVSRGEFIMRTDEHVMFDQGFDKKMTDACQPNWIMTAIRYFLDPVKWEVMKDIPPFIYEKLKIRDNMKFEGQRWPSRDKKRAHKMIDHTMATQGSVWVMPRSWWDKVIGELQTEGYGTMYQDSHEMIFKTWKAGGELMLNKNTWFAHKHYSFPRSHRYGSQDQDPSIKFCLDTWLEYYETVVKPRWKI
jgi:glycosyltransferase involved in cell wall biosynthesis